MVTTARRYTLADLADLPDDDQLYDILGGKLVVRSVPDDNHAEVLTELFGMLYAAQEAGYGRVYTSSRAVALDFPLRGDASEDVPHPDLFFVRPGREELRGRRALQGVPDLVVEVLSPSTRREHAPGGNLWRAYERNGLPYYWIVDPMARTITQYEWATEPQGPGRFGSPRLLREGDDLTSPLFLGVAVPLAQVFRYVRDYPPPRRESPRERQEP